VALLMTQRTLLLGLPMAVAAWTLWWQALGAADAGQARRRMLGAGVMIGLLPLAHSHCFAGSLLLAAVLALATRRAALWRPFFAAVLVLAVPQLALLAGDSRMHAREFLGVQLGWDRGTRDPVSFWLLNAGVFLALNLWALWRGGPPRLTLMSRAFFLLFLIPNLLRLSPWIWDNIKFLVQWHVASTPIVARVLARATRRGGWAGPLGWLGVIAATLSGALDVARVASRRIEQPLFDTDGVALARRIAESVPPAALILHAPTYNSPVYLSGRRSLLGYPGHIPSQGLDAGDREETIRRVYLGALAPSEVRAPRPLDFILVGPQERALGVLDERLLASPAVLAVGPYTLLRAAGAVEKPLATR